MCLIVYAASERRLPLVSWNEAAPGFYVAEVPESDHVRQQFDSPFIYELGSHEGCGCGFVASEAEKDASTRQASVDALHGYIRSQLATGPIRLFICWQGTERFPRPKPRVLPLNELRTNEFWARVRADAIDDRPGSWVIEPARGA